MSSPARPSPHRRRAPLESAAPMSQPKPTARRALRTDVFRLLAFAAVASAAALVAAPAHGDGIRPVGADGKPLNLGFEDGTLKDWTASGDAFKGQPIKGDVVVTRRSDMKSNHAGQYWIGGVGEGGDGPPSTLTHPPQ